MDRVIYEHLIIWLGGLGRIVDALVWLATLGWVKTQLHFKITQYGDPDWGRRPWIKLVNNHNNVVSQKGGKTILVPQQSPHWLNLVLASVLLVDGLVQTLCLGFVQSEFGVKLTFSDWWKAQNAPAAGGAVNSLPKAR